MITQSFNQSMTTTRAIMAKKSHNSHIADNITAILTIILLIGIICILPAIIEQSAL